MIRYTLYTERKENLPELVSRYFDGATLYDAQGLWQKVLELSAAIVILGSEEDESRVLDLAATIKRENEQQALIMEKESVEVAYC